MQREVQRESFSAPRLPVWQETTLLCGADSRFYGISGRTGQATETRFAPSDPLPSCRISALYAPNSAGQLAKTGAETHISGPPSAKTTPGRDIRFSTSERSSPSLHVRQLTARSDDFRLPTLSPLAVEDSSNTELRHRRREASPRRHHGA